MTRIVLPVALVAATLAWALPAQAVTLTRTYVSQAGNDGNPCTSTQPCRHFTNAYANTAANGVITALDPGGYGPITITGAITINGLGWASITAPSGGDGIIVNAGTGDQVTLIGLTVDGAGAGANGIVSNTGGSLTITDCVVQNFAYDGTHDNTGNGILIQPTTGTVNFLITNTTATNNGFFGIYYHPPSGTPSANGSIGHVVATSNNTGVGAHTGNATGGTTVIAIYDSIGSANGQAGFYAYSGTGGASLTVSLDGVSAAENAGAGVNVFGVSQVLIGRSVVTANGIAGIGNHTTSNTFYTYGDNRINLNPTDISSPLNTSFGPQ
jgi:hypothetical protein